MGNPTLFKAYIIPLSRNIVNAFLIGLSTILKIRLFSKKTETHTFTYRDQEKFIV